MLSLQLCVWVLVMNSGSWHLFQFSNHLSEEETAGFFTLIELWLYVFCVFLTVLYVGLGCVIVAFSGKICLIFLHNMI